MPYIPKEQRQKVDSAIDNLIGAMRSASACVPDEKGINEGVLNYCITRLCQATAVHKFHSTQKASPLRYAQGVNKIIGVLGCVSMEFYRRLAAPYEDTVAKTNGDVLP